MGTSPDPPARRIPAPLDLSELSFERGAHLLLKRALSALRPGDELGITGDDPALVVHVSAWCRHAGHQARAAEPGDAPVRAWVIRGHADLDRWVGAGRAGGSRPDQIVGKPPRHWGLAPRGALVEPGGPELGFDLADRDYVWADVAPSLYAHAASVQWDPAKAVAWDTDPGLPGEIEEAVIQVMTYLIENELAALV